MSSENYGGIIMAENLRFLGEGSSAQGKSGYKMVVETSAVTASFLMLEELVEVKILTK